MALPTLDLGTPRSHERTIAFVPGPRIPALLSAASLSCYWWIASFCVYGADDVGCCVGRSTHGCSRRHARTRLGGAVAWFLANLSHVGPAILGAGSFIRAWAQPTRRRDGDGPSLASPGSAAPPLERWHDGCRRRSRVRPMVALARRCSVPETSCATGTCGVASPRLSLAVDRDIAVGPRCTPGLDDRARRSWNGRSRAPPGLKASPSTSSRRIARRRGLGPGDGEGRQLVTPRPGKRPPSIERARSRAAVRSEGRRHVTCATSCAERRSRRLFANSRSRRLGTRRLAIASLSALSSTSAGRRFERSFSSSSQSACGIGRDVARSAHIFLQVDRHLLWLLRGGVPNAIRYFQIVNASPSSYGPDDGLRVSRQSVPGDPRLSTHRSASRSAGRELPVVSLFTTGWWI